MHKAWLISGVGRAIWPLGRYFIRRKKTLAYMASIPAWAHFRSTSFTVRFSPKTSELSEESLRMQSALKQTMTSTFGFVAPMARSDFCVASDIAMHRENRASDIINSLRAFYKTGTPGERQMVDV